MHLLADPSVTVHVMIHVQLLLCGRMVYIYPEKDLRAYPGAIRGTEEWNNTYKIRTTVERDINHIKDNLCLAGRRTQNEKNTSRRSGLLQELPN